MDILLHDNNTPVTIICAYSPPNTSSILIREKFYSQLRTVAKPTSWLWGNLNARVGRFPSAVDEDFGADRSKIVGPCSLKEDVAPNANGMLL